MKQILKYLLFLMIGIIIYILVNIKDNFSVGIPEYKIVNDHIFRYSSNRAWTSDEPDNIFEGETNLQNNPEYYVWADNEHDALEIYNRHRLVEWLNTPTQQVTDRELEEWLFEEGEPEEGVPEEGVPEDNEPDEGESPNPDDMIELDPDMMEFLEDYFEHYPDFDFDIALLNAEPINTLYTLRNRNTLNRLRQSCSSMRT
tara:strand:- start:928 stop:1527 length:600 start_codon:yes stop_codon:yes gene_type:complete